MIASSSSLLWTSSRISVASERWYFERVLFFCFQLVLEKVLLLGSKTQTIIGRPYVPKAFVHAAVEEQV